VTVKEETQTGEDVVSVIRYLIGDATGPESPGPKVIVHICNDIGRWGKGFVMALSRRWPEPEQAYRDWYAGGETNDFALGMARFVQVEADLWVANTIGQHGIRRRKEAPPVRYDAIRKGLLKVAEFAAAHNAAVHMPRIACGLAGGTWERVEAIVHETLIRQGVPVTVYDLPAPHVFGPDKAGARAGGELVFTFLGTGAARPSLRRNVSALAVQTGQSRGWVLFDCGEGTQHQLLRCRLAAENLDRVFITHLHGDHCFGLPGLLSARGLKGTTRPLQVFGPRGIRAFLLTALDLTDTPLDYSIDIREVEDEGLILETEGFTVQAVRLAHRTTCYAYVLQEADRPGAFDIEKARHSGIPEGPLYAKLKAGEEIRLPDGRLFVGSDFVLPTTLGRRIVIGGDNGDAELLLPYIEDTDLLVHEATYTDEFAVGKALKWGHSTAKAVAQTAEKAGVKNLVLTHISQRYGASGDGCDPTVDAICGEATQWFSGAVAVANDLDTFRLGHSGGHLRKE
jgi:ribonuclease Z